MLERYRRIFSALKEYIHEYSSDGYSQEKADILTALLQQNDSTPLDHIFQVFGCELFDKCTLTLALLISADHTVAMEISSYFGINKGYLTAGAVSGIFFGYTDIIPFYTSLLPDSPLDRLLDGVCAHSNAPLSVKDSIASFAFTGLIDDDNFLFSDEETEYLPLNSSVFAENEISSVLTKANLTKPFVMQIIGDNGSGRRTAIKRACESVKQPYIIIGLNHEISITSVKKLASKLLLMNTVPVIILNSSSQEIDLFLQRLANEVGFVFAVTNEEIHLSQVNTETLTVKLSKPTLEEQYCLWQAKSKQYPVSEDIDFAELSGEFEMNPGDIERAMSFSSMLSENDRLTLSDIKTGCYRSFASDMGTKAVRLNCVFHWDDIVLPERSKRLLSEACHQVRVRHRIYHDWGFQDKLPYGKGVSMIFTGPPGTGKTMSAQVMAKELGMEIYRVSLANVVSKYIGETEKNLNDIFEKAKRCRVILFFDEADVLFSKRTEVKDANDKYSNMESAFLLQKIEEYNGVVILATNLVQNFDEAFKRRMRFIIEFPFPDASHRRELWKKAFPSKTPLGEIDFDFLVEHFELSGSNIKNIALHSAFLAASDNSDSISMKHIMLSVRNEFSKSGKAFTKNEAGEYFYLL